MKHFEVNEPVRNLLRCLCALGVLARALLLISQLRQVPPVYSLYIRNGPEAP